MPEKVIKTTPPENDPVKHPNHYCYGKFECVEVVKELTAGASGPEGFLLGNVIKYLWRYRRKNGAEDLKKARRYIEMLIMLYEEMDGTRGYTATLDVAPCEKAPDGTQADTAIIDVAPGTVPIRNNRPVFSATTTWAAARLTGQNGEFFDALDGKKRTKGVLVKIENGLPSPYIARIQMPDRYIDVPYKYFSPLAPEPENGRPVFNRVVAEGAARYIGKEGEFFDLPGGIRKRGVLQRITGPACDFRFSALTEGGRGIYAFFSPLTPETRKMDCRQSMDGTRADTAIFDVFPGIITENGRVIYNRTIAGTAARYIGQRGEFFNTTGDGKRVNGTLVGIMHDLPSPYIARIQVTDPGPGPGPGGTRVARYEKGPYKFFSPLTPETEENPQENPQEKPEA